MNPIHRNEEAAAKAVDDHDNALGESKDDPAVADVLHFAHAVDHGQALLAMLAFPTAHIYELVGLPAPGDLDLYPLHPER
ncbi:MAG: hypothetical protein Q9172_001995 [Xanthocarpia lactea]